MTPEQIEFLKEEFGVDESDLAMMDQPSWKEIREKCAEIAISEYDEEDGEEVLSDRFIVAEEITDITFKMLQSAFARVVS